MEEMKELVMAIGLVQITSRDFGIMPFDRERSRREGEGKEAGDKREERRDEI